MLVEHLFKSPNESQVAKQDDTIIAKFQVAERIMPENETAIDES